MLCVKCGYDNPDGSNYCSLCNAKISPIAMYQEPPVVPQETARLDTIRSYCEKIRNGEIEMDVFAAYISKSYQEISDIEASIREIVAEESYDEISPDELEIGYRGLQCYLEGLNELYIYSENGEETHLDHGLNLVAEGNDYVNQARDKNREVIEQDGVIGTL